MANRPKTTATNPLGLDDPTLFVQKGIIGGKYVESSDGSTFEVDDPSTGKIIGTCPDMTLEDTRRAIEVAAEAFKTFSKTSPQQRSTWLMKFSQLYEAASDDITRLIVWENGKAWPDAKGETAYAGAFLSFNAGEALRTEGKTIPCSIPGMRNFTIKQPVGVVSLLVPWNFPAAMVARKIGPALAVGCTCVIKVPAETPYTNLAIIELAKRAGIPDGVLNVITTDKHLQAVGHEVTTNPLVRKVSFTGSTRIGKMLSANAMGTMKKISMELGGNAPMIIFEDADIDAAVNGTLASKFRASGQTCVCCNRIYVHESIYDEFAKKLVDKVKQYKMGNGFDDGVTHGPLIAVRQVDKVEEHVKDAVKHGAKVLAGGKRGERAFFEPTVLGDVPPACLISTEETFGPVAALFKFKTEDEVIELANKSEVGLAGYFFSQDSDRVWRVAEALQVGMVCVNAGVYSQAVIPFGGVKESGLGKEGAHDGTDEYCITKFVAIGTARPKV